MEMKLCQRQGTQPKYNESFPENKECFIHVRRVKSMKKKLLAALLCTVMALSCLSGCGSKPASGDGKGTDSSQATTGSSQPQDSQAGNTASGDEGKTAEELLMEPYPEPVDIHVVLQYRESENPNTPQDCTPETSTAVKLLKEELNINLIYDWIVNVDQFPQKFGAEIAAGNLPDVMMLLPNDYEDLVNQGGFVDLSEYYEKYRCDALDRIFNYDGNYINVGKKDGKLYGLPMGTDPAQMTSQLLYNMTQLESVGITSTDQLPKTIDEFEALCDKLMEVDYDGDGKTGGPVLPAVKNTQDVQLADFEPFLHAYETWVDGWYDDGTGTLQYAGIDAKLKDVLAKLNEWYDKGFFQKDFAAYDVWAADSPVINDIVAGKYAIVPGSWWVPNWPLNSNKVEHPESEWVIGPNLSLDGNQPKVMLDRYPVNNFVAVGRDCTNPEAVFKMMYWSLQYSLKNSNPDVQNAMTEEEKTEYYSYVYSWLPYRVYSPISLRSNFETVNQLVAEGKTTIDDPSIALNDEFWGSWAAYLKYKENPDDGVAWGTYFSRLAPDGGVANMIKTVETAEIIYDEVYITTPTLASRKPELDKLRDNTIISMVMGETPVSDFDKYVEQWKAQGGDEIAAELNEWYKNK